MSTENPQRVAEAASATEHPEDYCHRCGGPNLSWFTPGAIWDPVMRPEPGAPWKWAEIICPQCFDALSGGATWALLPVTETGPWTSWDERQAIRKQVAEEIAQAIEAAREKRGIATDYGQGARWAHERGARIAREIGGAS